jgi:predicted TIM-barrel fold metal-dependent hydrolase
MKPDDFVLVSVDDHIVEPPDVFADRLPRKYQDKAPRFLLREDGANVWVYEGYEMETWANNAVVGRPPEEYGYEPQNYSDVRPGVYDVHERVKDMSANGEWAALCFPTFPGFAGTLFANFAYRDPEQATAMVRAYNDWHLEAWCGAYPDRFIPLCITPCFDVEKMVTEVRRVANLGCHAMTFMGRPYPYPSLFSDYWNPFWAVCQELGTVVCIHLGAGASNMQMVDKADSERPPLPELEEPRFGARYVGMSATPGSPQAVAADLLNAHIFERFPGLRVSLSEGGIGWIPYFLEQADVKVRHHAAYIDELNFGGRLPSEIFKEHILCCFIEDGVGVASRSYLNIDMVAWEADYPHADCTWPESPELLADYFDDVSDQEVVKITHENAARVFQFDPFAKRPAGQCTVKALRQEVAHHDIAIRSRGFSGRVSGTATAKQFAAAETGNRS